MRRDDHKLVQEVLDGEVGRAGFDDFQNRLRAEPELAELYTDYAMLHHTLSEEFESGMPIHAAGARGWRVAGIPAWLLAAAAALVFAAAGWWFAGAIGKSLNNEAVMCSFSLDAVWEIDGRSEARGAATAVAKGGTVYLRQGRMLVTPMPSVSALIEGPAELRIVTTDALHLQQGRGFFELGELEGNLAVTTPRLSVMAAGSRFGLEVRGDAADELHVISGMVRASSLDSGEFMMIAGGSAVEVPDQGEIRQKPIDGRYFATGLGRFLPVVGGPFDEAAWRVAYGQPAISHNRIDGVNYAAYLRLPEPLPAGGGGVVLVTLETGTPAEGGFHSDGWAGMSLYSAKKEILFFGDIFGKLGSWGLEVKQGRPAIIPDPPLTGPRLVTMRYDSRSGRVSLHDGSPPLPAPFCSGQLPPGARFDEIRLGASAGAALAVKSLLIRASEE